MDDQESIDCVLGLLDEIALALAESDSSIRVDIIIALRITFQYTMFELSVVKRELAATRTKLEDMEKTGT